MINLKFHLQKEIKITRLYALTSIVTVILVVLAICFVNYILSNEFISAEKYLEQGVLQTASNLRGRTSNSINELRILSAKLSDLSPVLSENNIKNFLKNHSNDKSTIQLSFLYPDNRMITYNNNSDTTYVYENSDSRYLDALKNADYYFSITQDRDAKSGYAKEVMVPVYKGEKIAGALISKADSSIYLEILGYSNYNEKGISYIIDSLGNIIIRPKRDTDTIQNMFDADFKYVNAEKDDVIKIVGTQNGGTFLFEYNKRRYIASFAEIRNTGYKVLTIVPLYILMLHVDMLLMGVTGIVVIISLLLLALAYYSSRLFRENERAIYKTAFTDEVTGNGNRNKFKLEAQDILLSDKTGNYAIISMDIAMFKGINELYGVERANEILKDVYEILCKNLPPKSLCVRDYAATFIVLYKYENEDEIVSQFIKKVNSDIDKYSDSDMKKRSPDSNATISTKLSLSFGVYLIINKEESIDQMCERAYIAKRNIKGNINFLYKFYDDAMRARLLLDKAVEGEMYKALSNKEFHMYLQPKFYLQGRKLSGAEALVRWIHPQKGLVPPMDFIPLFERNGFVIEVDRCIWRQACEFLSNRKKEGKSLFPISVNVSRLHMNNNAFISELISLVKEYDIEPEYLELELTESACTNNESRFKEIINKLKQAGFTISMDDFGTGYSSLNMLRDLPIDILKLDRGFIKDTISDDRGQIVTTSIIEMANKLNIVTVAEGIEMEEQAEFLKNIGCQIAQGFLFGRPSDIKSFSENYLD